MPCSPSTSVCMWPSANQTRASYHSSLLMYSQLHSTQFQHFRQARTTRQISEYRSKVAKAMGPCHILPTTQTTSTCQLWGIALLRQAAALCPGGSCQTQVKSCLRFSSNTACSGLLLHADITVQSTHLPKMPEQLSCYLHQSDTSTLQNALKPAD